MTDVLVSAPSRVHPGLVDLTGATTRRFGGIGLMLDEPRVQVSCGLSATSSTFTGSSIDKRLHTAVLEALSGLVEQGYPPVHAKLLSTFPRHVGLGSGTATVMASLYAAALVAGRAPNKTQLSALSGRGGASGIGVYGALHGGWLVDAGQPLSAPLLPSGDVVPESPSLVVSRYTSPAWAVDLYLINAESVVKPVQEAELFRLASRDRKSDTLKALGLLHHGLVPAVIQSDLVALGSSLRPFQKIGLKRLEFGVQTAPFKDLFRTLETLYPAVGLSSFGPAVVALRDRNSSVPSGPHEDFLVASTVVSDKGLVVS